MSRSISDLIEEFIMSSLDEDEFIELSRNDLAKFFSCVPSQINYVLNTRFTVNRGFVVESQRGGSGYIKVLRVQDSDNNFLKNALVLCDEPISILQANQILSHLCERKLLSERECELIKSTISAKALNNPINMDNKLRANILRQVIIELMKLEDRK
ncbi:MAG: CtsR family transcriptional regulator [Clostridiales bacterium]|nr:CtsR family transcriptional regulator [Clostridiales bacterium]